MKNFLKTLFLCTIVISFQANAVSKADTQPQNIDDSYIQVLLTSQDFSSLQKLFDTGLDINSTDDNGYTMLMYSIINNADLKMSRFLIDAGADVNAPSSNGLTPLILAVAIAPELQNRIITETQNNPNLDLTREMKIAKEANQTKFHLKRALNIVNMLIDAGVDVNQETPFGTPLMKASTSDWNIDIVETLLKSGANVNQADQKGRTALFYAEAFGAVNVSSLLIKYGAIITHKDNFGKDYLNVNKDEIFDD